MKTINNLVIISTTFLLLLTACSSEQDQTFNQAPAAQVSSKLLKLNAKQQKALGIQIGGLSQQELGLTIFANGQIEVPPQNKSYISMPFGGYIKQIKVLDGMRVKKGQVLMSVEHPDIIQLQQDYLEVLGEFSYLEADYLRQKQLFEKEAGSAKSYQQAKSAYAVAKAKMSGLQVKLEMAEVNLGQLKEGKIQRVQQIRSPFDGVVTKVTANVGAFAEPKDRLLEIIDLKHAHAELIVYEKYMAYLKKEQKVKLNFIDDTTPVEANIFLIGSEISPERTVKVHCHFKKLPASITPGSYLKAEIQAEVTNHFVLPNEAVVQYNGKDVVFIQEGDNFLPVEIDLILSNEEFSAIGEKNRSKLMHSKIILKGAYDLLAILNKEVE
jgi:cobalt-zinc-cadmium efflux system membrane fusion protein